MHASGHLSTVDSLFSYNLEHVFLFGNAGSDGDVEVTGDNRSRPHRSHHLLLGDFSHPRDCPVVGDYRSDYAVKCSEAGLACNSINCCFHNE